MSPALVSVVGMGGVRSLISHDGVVLGSPVLKEDGEARRESPPGSAVEVSEAVAPTVEGDAGCRLSISALVSRQRSGRHEKKGVGY